MPRGRKKTVNLPLDQQIAMVDEKIASAEEQIKILKLQKKELIAKKDNEEVEKLLKVVKESGKSVDEWLAMVNGTND